MNRVIPAKAAFRSTDWWSGEFEGKPDAVGAEFVYEMPGAHWCRMQVTELVPGKTVEWRVTESILHFTKTRHDWDGTVIRFDLAQQDGGTRLHFAHVGLSPGRECWDACSSGWDVLLRKNLKNRVATGRKQPNVFAA